MQACFRFCMNMAPEPAVRQVVQPGNARYSIRGVRKDKIKVVTRARRPFIRDVFFYQKGVCT